MTRQSKPAFPSHHAQRPALAANITAGGTRIAPTRPGEAVEVRRAEYVDDEEARAVGEWLEHLNAGRLGGD